LGAQGKKLVDILKDDYHEYVNDFKKKSQTSITLRIALKSRKVMTKAFSLPVPESFVEQQIITLDVREKECRKVIKANITSLQNDVQEMMNRTNCPEEIKEILTKVDSDLKLNAEHFNSGKDIEEMPMIYESIELSAAPQVIEEMEEQKPEIKVEKNTEPAQPKTQEIKLGFFNKFWKWLTTPSDKKWKDID